MEKYIEAAKALNPVRKVVDEELYGDKEAHYPAVVFLSHLGMKGLQAGSILGTFAVVPIMKFVRKTPIGAGVKQFVPLCAVSGAVLVLLAPIGMAVDEAGVDDRGYRLGNNKPQLQVDRYSSYGAGLGAAVGALTGSGLLAGGSLGIAAGVGYYLAEQKGLVAVVKVEAMDLIKLIKRNLE